MISPRNVLYLPVGPPGSGKSSLAMTLRHRGVFDHHAVVSPDYFREALTGKRADQSVNAQVFEICNKIVRARLVRDLPVYYDATNLLPEWREPVVRTAETVGSRVVTFFLKVDPDTCRYLNQHYDREEIGAVVPDGVMDMMLEQYATITPESLPGTIITIDGILDIENAADKVLGALVG